MRILLVLFVVSFFPLLAGDKSGPTPLATTSEKLLFLEEEIAQQEYALLKKQEEEKELREKLLTRQNQLSRTIKNIRNMAMYSPILVALANLQFNDFIHSLILVRSLGPKIQRSNNSVLEILVQLKDIRDALETQKNGLIAQGNRHNELLKEQTLLIEAKYGQLQELKPEGAQEVPQNMEDLFVNLLKVFSPSDFINRKNLAVRAPVLGERDYPENKVIFKARKSAQVLAPIAGRVVFAGMISDQGQVVIIRQEDFYVIIKGMGSAICQMGEDLALGEPLGRMPSPLNPEESSQGRVNLELELRRGTELMDIKSYLVDISNTPTTST
jgi:septal ring factor EnvC (AmiA/AmiB activator)